MRRSSVLLILILSMAIISPVTAETIAISVRQQSDEDEAPVLAARAEQGAMELLFGAGHIVFDLDIEPNDDDYLSRAVESARAGGAWYVVILELTFETIGERGFEPDAASVTVVEIDAPHQMDETVIHAGELERDDEMSAVTIADRLGAQAAAFALDSIGGGESEW
ncbi:MAG: hypothetical protein R6W94_06025 [Spirochaetia bacterium]